MDSRAGARPFLASRGFASFAPASEGFAPANFRYPLPCPPGLPRPSQAVPCPPFRCAQKSVPSKPPPTPPFPLALPEGDDRSRQAYRYLQQEALSATLREAPAASSYQPAFRSNRWGAAELAAPRFAPPNLSATAQKER